ncbi:MAG: hypothetical protein JWO86_8749 [Myxococcaceae bacterium]|nr:hypothetical protein [Myxococcaceae bacterium]
MFPFFPVHMDVAQQVYVQARAEERIRTGNDVTAEETELQPQLRYDFIWKGGTDHFVAIYNPRLIYTHTFKRPTIDPALVNTATLNLADPNDTPVSALHNGGLALEIVRPRWRLAAYQFGAYGTITTTALLVHAPWVGEGPPPDPVAIIPSTIAGRFTLLFLQTQVLLPIKLSRRVALTPQFVYNSFGGADSESRGVIAATFGPGVSLALEADATRRDRFTTTIGAGTIGTAFEGGRTGDTIYRAEATQAWRHYYARDVYTEVSGGMSVGNDALTNTTYYPLWSAGVFYDSYPFVRIEPGAQPQGAPLGHGNRVQLALVAKEAPWIDIFSGELEERVIGLAAVNYTIGPTTLRSQLSTGVDAGNTDTKATYQIVELEAGVRYAVAPTFFIEAGLRFGYQDFTNAIRANSITQETVYAGLTWAPLPARF